MHWDIFCKVIDNHGDIGVCWRLAANLVGRGHTARLWADDARALQWMAPEGKAGVEVCDWPANGSLPPSALQHTQVLVEAFGCEIAPELIATCIDSTRARGQFCPWINLEYLSAETFVERAHGLPSPVMSGPAHGQTKHFFYPGFTPRTGGLLREPDLPRRQAAFDREAWATGMGLNANEGRQWVSLFCYEPSALSYLLRQLAGGARPARLLVTAGRAAVAVQEAVARLEREHRGWNAAQRLAITSLPYLTQHDYDHLLWACDFNFVRGEDSLVRALWAGRPFAWHIYPQHDDAHHHKLLAFLDLLAPPEDWRQFHHVWNGMAAGPLPRLDVAAWTSAARHLKQELMAQEDLCSQLIRFVEEKR